MEFYLGHVTASQSANSWFHRWRCNRPWLVLCLVYVETHPAEKQKASSEQRIKSSFFSLVASETWQSKSISRLVLCSRVFDYRYRHTLQSGSLVTLFRRYVKCFLLKKLCGLCLNGFVKLNNRHLFVLLFLVAFFRSETESLGPK